MALMQARVFSVTLSNAITNPGDSSTDFLTQANAVGSNEIQFAAVTKDTDFKQPEITTEEVKLLGSTAGAQNLELDPQAPTKGEFTATLIGNPENDNEFDFEQFMLTAHGTNATGYDKRYNFASAAPTAGVAIVIQESTGTGIPKVNWLLNNATVETLGGIKIDADGHGEMEIRITAAASDCWKEWDLAPS